MVTKNDERVLQLKQIISEKKQELKSPREFYPVTNCILTLDNQTYNFHVLKKEDLEFLLVKLHSYETTANELDINLMILEHSVSEWIEDVKAKIEILNQKKKKAELKILEDKLDKMLSDEKKTEIALDEIAAALLD